MRAACLATFAVLAVAACASPASDPTAVMVTGAESEVRSTRFETTLSCESGAATLERDTEGTTTLDLDHGGVELQTHALEFSVKDRRRRRVVRGGRGLVVRDPVHAPRGQQGPRHQPDRRHRVRGEADRVRVVFNDVTRRMTCSTYFEEDHCAFDSVHGVRGELTVERTDTPIADWVFTCVAPQ